MVRPRQNSKMMRRFQFHRSRWCFCSNCYCCCCNRRRPVVLVSLIIILGMYQLVLLHTSHIVQLKMNNSFDGVDWNRYDHNELLLQSSYYPQITRTSTTTTTRTTTSTRTTPTKTPPTTPKKTIVIAYAISVTSCHYNDTSSRVSVLDGAAILGHSIHLSSIRSRGAGMDGRDGDNDSSGSTRAYNNATNHTTIKSSKSNYDYKLYAFVYGETVDEQCQIILSQQLGYTVIVKDTIPFGNISHIHDDTLREVINTNGCCGSIEYMKLYSYTLLHHPIVVHLDIDSIILQPLDIVFDNILNNMRIRRSRRREVELDPKHIQRRGGQKSNMQATDVGNARIDDDVTDDDDDDNYYDHFFYFTRDYYQQTKHAVKDPLKYGIQGGFFIITPSLKILNILTSNILNETYTKKYGWSKKGYNGFWGDTQIQGFLSYAYSYYDNDGYFIINHNNNNVNTTNNSGGGEENHSDSATTRTIKSNNASNDAVHVRAVELNRCIYNSMINDDPYYYDNKKQAKIKDPAKRKCRTGEEVCEDCRETPFENIKTIHYTTCRKPWECPYLKPPQPTLCKDAHYAWYKIRQQLELSWGYQPPSTGNWHYERTLGYCNRMINNGNSNNNETATATNSTSNNGKRNNKQRQYIPIEYPFGLY